MKNLFKFLGLSVLAFIICYLMGAFISVSFDISCWKEGVRDGVVVASGFSIFFLAFLIVVSMIPNPNS